MVSKRFTDTEIWSEDWFLNLSNDQKIFWKYLVENCDHAGIWKPNKIRFSKLTGLDIDHEKTIEMINMDKERICVLPNGRWFLTGFVPFQYGTKLNLANRMHKSVYELLLYNKVELWSIRPQVEVTQGVKDKDKDKNKVKKKESLTLTLKTFGKYVNLSDNDYIILCNRFGKAVIDDYIERINDWISAKGKKPLKDYAATIRNWIKNDTKGDKHGSRKTTHGGSSEPNKFDGIGETIYTDN